MPPFSTFYVQDHKGRFFSHPPVSHELTHCVITHMPNKDIPILDWCTEYLEAETVEARRKSLPGSRTELVKPIVMATRKFKLRKLGRFQKEILYEIYILGEDANPSQILKNLTIGLRETLTYAQVYLALRSLEKRGLLSSKMTPRENAPQVRTFKLEHDGVLSLSTAYRDTVGYKDSKIFNPNPLYFP